MTGHTRLITTTITCSHCHEAKPLSDFAIRANNGRPHSWCRQCKRALDRLKYAEKAAQHEYKR